MAQEGWGAQLLSHRRDDGTWPPGWYSPKWTSTFYSLQVLQQLGVPAPESVHALLAKGVQPDVRFCLWSSGREDTCVRAMMLTMANGAGVPMPGTVERLLAEQMPDGGWNCRPQATHASFHTTLSTLEALAPFETSRVDVAQAAGSGREFLLAHGLFRSHRTGEIVRESFTRFSFPHYWYYDVLRALDYWRAFYVGPAPGRGPRPRAPPTPQRHLDPAEQAHRPDLVRHGASRRTQPMEHPAGPAGDRLGRPSFRVSPRVPGEILVGTAERGPSASHGAGCRPRATRGTDNLSRSRASWAQSLLPQRAR